MTVGILEAAAVHQAVILFRSGVGRAAGGDGILDNPIDAVAAVERQTEQRLELVLRIDDPLRGEVGEVTRLRIMRQSHPTTPSLRQSQAC